MNAQSNQEGARKLLEVFESASPNVILDSADEAGIFGQLYHPNAVMDSLLSVATTEENVGVPNVPPSVAVHSLEYERKPFLDLLSTTGTTLKNWHQVPIQVLNSSNADVRIRWIDHKYGKRASHTWNLRPRGQNNDTPSPSWVQHCSPGHLFLFSILNNEGSQAENQEEDLFSAYDHDYVLSQEVLLGAFRPLRPLPSGSYLSIVIRQEDEPTSRLQTDSVPQRSFVVEAVIHDVYDALVVAAASLDPYTAGSGAVITINLLKTVLSNVVKHPDEEKYRKLRLSNPKIQKNICSSWGAVQFLTLCGFEQHTVVNGEDEAEDYLVIPPTTSEETAAELRETQSQSLKLLDILSSRGVQGFVPDLAPPTPWESSRPVAGNGGGGRNRRWAENQDRRMGFVTPEERWARAERVNRNRRNGRARRPNPGEAPSSRGNWGR
jgi:hypothetical protein